MSDQGLYVTFNLEPRIDKKATEERGETVWKNVEYIKILVPGDKTNIPHRPVTDKDRQRFAKQYEAWKRGQQNVQEGQPLKTWPGISPAEVNMLAQSDIHTVEALAAVSDANASRVGKILALRDKARRFVEQSRSQAPVDALNTKVEELKRENEALSERLERAIAMLEKGAPNAEVPAKDSASTSTEEPPSASEGKPPPRRARKSAGAPTPA